MLSTIVLGSTDIGVVILIVFSHLFFLYYLGFEVKKGVFVTKTKGEIFLQISWILVLFWRLMGVLSIMGNSFGCSASGERLVSAARRPPRSQGLLEYNPRLARYSTFGVRNSPLHYSAARGHHEIVSLLLESGVDINLQNVRGQL
ncbi:probable E3 ubiquitin-protein ligase XBOS32 isoform X3 [Elaeis guineensis]|uniref:probable E3 ubiquitin-protein ligase XBOS32 isoform X3 n=2 Tax=Elaeis guineensis var. tenera TaxID=51953 RepID=UPI003C6D2DB8